jgi:aspartate/methionine/tyrosine aminotransferase
MSVTRPLAKRVTDLKPSPTIEMTERLRAARAAGRPVLSLSSGDPNLKTDSRIIDAALKAMREGDTHYAPVTGLPALRQAIAEREKARTGAPYDANDILVTPGGKFALLLALMGTVSAGDEVIIPEPGWVSYGPCVQLCGGVPVVLPMLDTIDTDSLGALVTSRTVAIVLNSPVNPTGRVLNAADLKGVVALAHKHNLWIIFDQVYSDLMHEGIFCFPQASDSGYERTLVIDSFSKTFGMTGWRLGYLAMPSGMTKPMQRFLQHSIYCVPGFIQKAGIVALSLIDEITPTYRKIFRTRQIRAAERLNEIPGVHCALPDAGIYLFPRVDVDDAALAVRWLERLNVSTLPGSAFGPAGAGHLRLSVTSDDSEIDAALDILVKHGLNG